MKTEKFEVRRIKVTWDNNLHREGYLPDVHTIVAKEAEILKTSWEYEGKTYFDLLITWFSESVRPLKKYEAYIPCSNLILKLSIDNTPRVNPLTVV